MVRWSDFDVNTFTEKRPAGEEADGYEGQRIAQGSPLGCGNCAMNAVVEHIADAHVTKDDGQQFTQNVEKQGVDTEHLERHGPTTMAADVDEVHEQSLQGSCQTTGHQHIRRTPDALVQRQSILQQVPQNDECGPCEQESIHLLRHISSLHHALATVETD